MNRNPNPRIGVLLDHHKASARLCNVLWRFHRHGLKWLSKHWPEERLRRELRGYGKKCSREWNGILLARNPNLTMERGRLRMTKAGEKPFYQVSTATLQPTGKPFVLKIS